MPQEQLLSELMTQFQHREAHANGHARSAWFDFQKRSFERLLEVTFPDRRHEDWKYTPVQKLIGNLPGHSATIQPELTLDPIAGLDTCVFHIRNGMVDLAEWPAELTAAGLRLRPLVEAFEDGSWQATFGPWIPGPAADAGKAFDLLNAAFHTSAVVLEIPANTVLEKPIECRIIHHDDAVSISHPLYFIHAGQNSQVHWIERYEGPVDQAPESPGLINAAEYIHLEANASLTHTRWQNLPSRQRLVTRLFVTQQRDSRFTSQVFDMGGEAVRHNIDIELEASNTFTSLEGAYVVAARQSVDHQTRINHKVPHGESHEWYKGILDEAGTAAFNGKVYVHPDAQKTNAYQQNDAIVLSPHALMNSKPQLEIYADDVRCSHGATIGQLNTQGMFYLRSRGLDEATARQMLKSAFLAPLVAHIEPEALRTYIGQQMGIES